MSGLAQINLVLFFTRGVSLKTWDDVGMFEREVALYRHLRPHLGGIAFVTYGDASDLAYADRLPGIDILCNERGLSPDDYARAIPRIHGPYLRQAHVFKTNQIPGADVALEAARVHGAKVIARCGYLWSYFAGRDHGPESGQAQHAGEKERLAFTAADRVVVTTPAMQRYVTASYGVPLDRVSVIPNYVLTDLFRPLPGVEPMPRRVLFAGRLEPQKNTSALLEAVKGLDVELVLVGSGSLRDELEARAQAAGINANFRGNLPHRDLPAEFNRAELFILPSLWEGHPKTLLEAMACGRPVIGADAPGIRELIVHGQNGYLCGTDSRSIRAALQAVLGNAELQAHLGQRAQAFVRDYFSLERVLEMELELLRRTADLSDPAPRPPRRPSLARRFLTRLGNRLPPAHDKAAALASEAIAYAQSLDPAEALRFLFDLENRLYPFQGQMAVAYGGGVHTKHRHMRYHDFFVKRVQPGERVLDIGCGNGAVAYDVAAKAGAVVVGIDLNADSIATAQARYAHPNVRYLVGDALKDLPGEHFDVVIMSNVLEHLEERPEFLRRVLATVRPARFLIRVPLFERHWSVPLKQELGIDYRLDSTHCIEYTQEYFADEVQQAELEIVHQEVRWGEIWAELRRREEAR